MFGKLKEKLQNLLKKPEETEKSSEQLKTKKEIPKKTISAEQKKEILPDSEIKKTEEKTFLQKISKKVLSSTKTISKEQVQEIFEPIEIILLENNVALKVVDKISKRLEEDLVGLELKKTEDLQKLISKSLKESISQVLIEPPNLIQEIKKKSNTYTIVFFGINGSGKTTSIAKLAHKLKKENISCILAAADTFRAASIEQLEKHAKKLSLKLIKHEYGADPAAVAFDAKAYAQKNNIKCVLVDTAGRMYTKSNLIREMEKIIRVLKPDLKIFVGESITGNDAIEQVSTFNEAIGIDGIILTKADVDEKGGTALSVSEITNKPIYFLGIGQEYSDLEDFNKKKILEKLELD